MLKVWFFKISPIIVLSSRFAIWNFCFSATMTDKQLYPKRNVLLSQLACPELNSFNMASVAESVIRRRKAMFFRALFAFFL
ncbi:hypothetical protein D918_01132 [Trichuris suis]|nr:hypothetical protein D918_01132 [Trichuris suis]